MNVLNVENLSAAYRKNLVLNGISFAIPQGSLTGIVGPNGAGKSTLIKVLLGLHPKLTGNVSFFGSTLRDVKKELVMFLNVVLLTGIFQRMHWMLY